MGKRRGDSAFCARCGKEYYRPPSAKGKYCSQACYHHVEDKPFESCRYEGCTNEVFVRSRLECKSHYVKGERERNKKKCVFPECLNWCDYRKTGLCLTHQRQLKTTGSTRAIVSLKRPPHKNGARARWYLDNYTRQVGECLEWTGATNFGYGTLVERDNGGLVYTRRPAHRYIYHYLVKPLTKGMTLDHLCRNRLCVNPDHLDEVSNNVNVKRMFAYQSMKARIEYLESEVKRLESNK